MSGPIIRKYGFPNFDKIFGERALQHGSDDADAPAPEAPEARQQGDRTAADVDTPSDPPFDAKVDPATQFGKSVE